MDALILTALRDELNALIGLDEGETPWEALKDSQGCLYYTRTLENEQGQKLKLAAASVSEMGKAGAAARSTQLLMELNPPCILMCGICAGNASEGIQLGDLVVADRVYSYDSGKHVGGESGREEIFFHDIVTYNLERAWKHQVEEFLREPKGWKEALDKQKPPSKEAQKRWLMHALYAHQEEGADEPILRPERKQRCPNWARTIEGLEEAGLIEVGDTLKLSAQGIKQVKRERLLHPDGWPEEPGISVYIGAMATGEAVQQDKELFAKLKKAMRKTLAVEMEAAAVGYAANFLDRRALVVKAVVDFGNAEKDDSYREFGCRASAAFVMAFVRRWLEPATRPMDRIERAEAEEDNPYRGPREREELYRYGHERRDDPFWEAVRAVTKLRNPEAQRTEKQTGQGFAGLIEVRTREGEIWNTSLVAGINQPYSEELVQRFIERIEKPYRSNNPMMRSTLVHGGERAPRDQQDRYFQQRGILLTNLSVYQGLIDFSRFLEWQQRKLDRNPAYPSEFYIEQPAVLHAGFGNAPVVTQNALLTLHETLSVQHPRFVLLLGEFGTGKTFLLHELTKKLSREQPGLVPVLVEMGQLQKSIQLEKLLAQHFAETDGGRIAVDSFLYMLGQGRIALLLDGFDELAFRSDRDLVQRYFQTVMGAMRGNSKVVLASRRSHFLSDNDYKSILAQQAERLSGFQTLLLSKFDEPRIRRFFVKFLEGNEAEADARLSLYRSIEDLMGLAANPRMMSFIAELSPEELKEAAAKNKAVTPGVLYKKLIERWFRFERERTREIGEQILNERQMDQAIRWVALHAWPRPEKTVSLGEMPGELQGILRAMTEHGRPALDDREAAHELRSRSLLIRDEEGRFGFLHQSIMEWWVAKVAADEFWLSSFEDAPTWERADMSDLMAGFFVDLVGEPDALRRWVGSVLSPEGKGKLKAFLRGNALRVLRYLDKYFAVEEEIEIEEAELILDLSGQDLRGRDFAGSKELRGADARGANLSDATLAGADLSGADLRNAVFLGADLRNAVLAGADLREADVSEANLCGADMEGVLLDQTRMERTKLVGARGLAWTDEWEGYLKDAGAALPRDVVPEAFVDTTSGNLIGSVGGPRIAFGPNNKQMAWARGESIAIYDVRRGQLLRLLHGHKGFVLAVAFSPDGRTIASASWDNSVRLWDARSGQLLLTLLAHSNSVTSVAFSPDGRILASASWDNSACLWDARSGQLLLSLLGHSEPVTSVAFSPDGGILASASDDHSVRLWDARSGQLLLSLLGHSSAVTSVAFGPDGGTIASASDDNSVRLWDARSGQLLLTLMGHSSAVTSVAFGPDGGTIASASWDNSARLWDARSGQLLLTFRGHLNTVTSIAFSPDGGILASASDDQSARLWDARSGQLLLSLLGHSSAVTSVAFSPDGGTIASASFDNSARLWDARSGQLLLSLLGHSMPVTSVAFSPDGGILASASHDKSARLWDARSGQLLLTLLGHSQPVTSVAFSPDGGTIASASYDKSARLWDARSGQLLLTLLGHSQPVYSVAFCPDGRILASASWDKSARLWDARSGQLLLSLLGHSLRVTSVAFSPDGGTLASASYDHSARLWDARSGKCLHILEGHHGPVTSVTWHPSGTRLITSSQDGTLRLWSAATGQCLAILFPLPNGWVAYRPKDGRYRASGDLEGRFFHTIGLCRFEPGELDPYLPTPLTLAEDEALIPGD